MFPTRIFGDEKVSFSYIFDFFNLTHFIHRYLSKHLKENLPSDHSFLADSDA